MKTFVTTFALLLCSSAFAQDATPVTTTETPAAGTISTEAQAPKSPFKLVLGSESYNLQADRDAVGSRSPIISYNYVGGRYVMSPNWEFELRQQFQTTTSRTNLSGRDASLHENSSAAIAETVARVIAKPKPMLGASMNSFELRYYAPTDKVSQENKEAGRLRADAYAEWVMTPKLTLAGWLSPRALLNTSANPNKAKGADAEYYQIKAAPYAIYNVNDQIAPYFAYVFAQRYANAQRGDWTPDAGSTYGSPELGLNLSYGAFFINPAIGSDTSLSNGQGSIFTADSRVYSHETIAYYLNVYATF